MNPQSEPRSSSAPRLRNWPYVVSTSLAMGALCAFAFFKFWTAPVPPGVDDDSGSPLGILFVKAIMVVLVAGCSVIGALLGQWMAYVARISSSSRARRNIAPPEFAGPPERPTGTRRPRGGVVTLILAAAMFYLFWVLLFPDFSVSADELAREAQQKAQRREQAQSDACGLVSALRAYYADFGAAPTGSHAEIVRTLRGENPRKVVYYQVRGDRLTVAGELLDPWGTPFEIKLTAPSRPRVYSFGPNQADERDGPSGDDIGCLY